MLNKIQNIWNEKGYEILLITSLSIILIFSLFKIGKKGTWSSSFIYNNNSNKKSVTFKNPVKKSSRGELECRRVLIKIFNKPFKTYRPNFLKNPITSGDGKGDYNLELDCFEPSLNLAAEYNGVQHYKYVPFFHKNKEAFRNQQYRDELKRRMCKDNKINLIEVPYTVKICDIETYVRQQLKLIGY